MAKTTIVLLLAFASFGTLAQTVGICDRTPEVRDAILKELEADDCAAVDSESLAGIDILSVYSTSLATLQAGDFNGLDGLVGLGLFDNQLTALPDGVFDGLTGLEHLYLNDNQLTALPNGVFDGMSSLRKLYLDNNRLTALPDGVFDDLSSLQRLYLYNNQLTSLPDGVFDGLSNLQKLYLNDNKLTVLPDGVFDDLSSLQELYLFGNRLVGLTRDDPLFAAFSSQVDIRLRIPRLVAAVPLMLSASNSGKQGFVRIVNEGDESGIVRILAFDDGGNAPYPFALWLEARQAVHFNANDLENGNVHKGIEHGVGTPVEGDWRLDIETDLPVQVLSFVRHGDGFLTAMHDVLPRTDGGRLVAHTFNPGSNLNQASSLRLVNTGENDASVSIEGVDDGGNTAGPVTLTLPAGESRTFSAVDLESGTHGLSGTLGDGAGKWRLFVTAGSSVVGMSLLESANGNLTNISTMGVATGG